MNRAKLLLTLLLAGVLLLTAQQEMQPKLGAYEPRVNLRAVMTPDEFKSAGLGKLTPAELTNLNLWVEELLMDVQEKINKNIEDSSEARAARPESPLDTIRCKHGCNRYGCNKQNCTDKCKAAPCRACWRSE
jgi:hypothetical protein